MLSPILLPELNSTEYLRKNFHNTVAPADDSYCENMHSALNVEIDSYQDILPYLIQNIPMLIRTVPEKWLSIQKGITELRNHTEFCDQNICTVEEFQDNKNDENTGNDLNENGYGKTRKSIKLEEFFIETLDRDRDDIYLKDWHIDQIQDLNLKLNYTVPESFSDDWLNWYWKSCRNSDDDYSFLYIGGKRTFTSLHHDVCCSNSWSVNIFGKKKWTLWPPSESYKLALRSARTECTNKNQDELLNKMAEDAGHKSIDVDIKNDLSIDVNKNLDQYLKPLSGTKIELTDSIDDKNEINHSNNFKNRQHDGNHIVSDAREGYYCEKSYPDIVTSCPLEFYQTVGDVLFVPSGWYHQVQNLGNMEGEKNWNKR